MKLEEIFQNKKTLTIILALLILLGASLTLFNLNEGKNKSQNKNVILISVDALRADHMSLYGYKRNTTPYLKELSSDSLVYENSYSASTWTVPSMTSIFTSKYPSEHSVIKGWDNVPREMPTLQETLSKKGYKTTGITPFGFNREAFNRTFDRFVFLEKGRRNAKSMTNTALRNLNQSKPFFMWLHYVDPHYPYFVPESVGGTYSNVSKMEWKCNLGIINKDFWEKEENRQYCENLYDEEIKFTDRQIGRFIEELKERGLMEDSILIITADHGEAFGEHGKYYHVDVPMYEEIIHVPLIVKGPSLQEGRIKGEIDSTKIAPTVLELLNFSETKEFKNKTLPLKKKDEYDTYALSEFITPNKTYKALIKSNYKYIDINGSRNNNSDMFFNLEKDLEEKNNLLNSSLASKYRENVKSYFEQNTSLPQESKLSNSLKNTLRNLGYLN